MSTTPVRSYEGEVTAWKINGKLPQESVAELRELINSGDITPEKYNVAVIDYEMQNDLLRENTNMNYYSLKIGSFKGAPWIFISHVHAGYDGPSPNGTLVCLKLLGFNLTPNEESLVLTCPNGEKRIRLSFYK